MWAVYRGGGCGFVGYMLEFSTGVDISSVILPNMATLKNRTPGVEFTEHETEQARLTVCRFYCVFIVIDSLFVSIGPLCLRSCSFYCIIIQ